MFYALSTNQDFIKSKVNLFVAFAPIVRMQYSSLGLELLSAFLDGQTVLEMAEAFGIYSLMSDSQKNKEK